MVNVVDVDMNANTNHGQMECAQHVECNVIICQEELIGWMVNAVDVEKNVNTLGWMANVLPAERSVLIITINHYGQMEYV